MTNRQAVAGLDRQTSRNGEIDRITPTRRAADIASTVFEEFL